LGSAYYSDGARFDPSTQQWQPMAPPPSGFAGRDIMSVASNGTVGLIWGGCAGPFGDGATYDPALDSWSLLPSQGAPSARCGAPAVWVGSSTFLLFGGRGAFGSGVVHDTGARYSNSTGWSSLTTPLGLRNRHTLVVVDGRPIVWGGVADFDSTQ